MGHVQRALALCALSAAFAAAARASDVPFLQVPRLSLAPVVTLDDTPGTPVEQKPTAPAPTSYGMTGDWFGVRNSLEAAHLTFGGLFILDIAKNLRGGLDTDSWPYRYLLDLHVVVDANAMGLPGGTGYFDVQSHNETDNRDTAVGDIQAYDNLEGPRFVEIAQVWYKQALGDFRLKIGRIDVNTDAAAGEGAGHDAFSLLNHGLLFFHSGAAYAPANFAFPTYPNPSPGVELFYGQEEGPYAGFGAFYANSRTQFLNLSGHPETVYPTSGGFYFIAETGGWWKLADKPGHAGIGGWYHSGEFAKAANPGQSAYGAAGAYFLIEQTLYEEEPEGLPAREVGCFFTAGWTDPATSQMDQSLTLGLTAAGFVPARPDDGVGVMTSWVHLPAIGSVQRLDSFEWATEVYYNIQLTHWAALRPAFDYIITPSGIHPDAAVAMLRIEIDF